MSSASQDSWGGEFPKNRKEVQVPFSQNEWQIFTTVSLPRMMTGSHWQRGTLRLSDWGMLLYKGYSWSGQGLEVVGTFPPDLASDLLPLFQRTGCVHTVRSREWSSFLVRKLPSLLFPTLCLKDGGVWGWEDHEVGSTISTEKTLQDTITGKEKCSFFNLFLNV